MRMFYFILLLFGLYFMSSCNNEDKSVEPINGVEDSFKLPGVVTFRTVFFDNGNIYYHAMDEPGKETFKCFSLQRHELVWSLDMTQTVINKGAISSTGEIVVPTLSDSVYLIDTCGSYRILKLEDRCKINPLIYKNTFIIQDRGIGLKCFDAKTLQELWVIKQSGRFTMSQPLLLSNNIVYVLDDNSIQSSDVENGKLNWRINVTDTFSVYNVYGNYKDLVFILSSNLKEEKKLTAVNYNKGNISWSVIVDSDVNVFEKDMVVTRDVLFCKGENSIYVYSLQNGKRINQYNFQSRITTNLVVDRKGSMFFGLEDKTLMKIDSTGNATTITTLNGNPDRLYQFNHKVFLYAFPYLYSLSQ